MTETPDPAIAALAVQLAALKDNLGQAREDLETARRELAARIDQLASSLATEAEHGPKGPPATFWPVLDADARTAKLAVLTEWVTVMRQWHPAYFEPVADCWASHPEVVIELHNVMTEFTRVYRRETPPARRHPAPVRPVAPRHAPPLPRRHEILRARRMRQDTTAHVQAALQMRTRMPRPQPRPPARTPGAPAPARARPCNPRAETTRNQATTTRRR